MKNKQLRKIPVAVKAGAGYLIGNIILRGITLLTTPIFTSMMLPSDYGQYSIYMSYEAFIAIFVLAGMSGSIRRAKIDFKNQLNEYVVNITLEVTLNFAVLLIIADLIELFGIKILGYDILMINLLLFHSWFDSVIHIYSVRLSADYKYKEYVGVTCLITVLNIFLSIILIKYLYIENTYYGRIFGTVISMIVGGFLSLIFIVKGNRIRVNRKMWKYSFGYSFPLMIHSLSMTILSSFDRIMIFNMVGDFEAGIYSLIYSFGMAISLIWGSLDTSWTQWVFDKLEHGKGKQVSEYAEKYIGIMLLLVILAMLVSPEILWLFMDEAYYQGIRLFMPLCAGAFIGYLYTFYVQIENYYRKTQYVAIGTFISGVINILLNYILIKIYGYEVAAYTTEISYVALLLFHSYTVRKLIKRDIYKNRTIFGACFLICISSILIEAIEMHILLRWLLAFFVGIIFVIYVTLNMKKIMEIKEIKRVK